MGNILFVNYGDTVNTPIEQYMINSMDDIENIEKKFGACVYIISERKLYICNADLEWTSGPAE